MKIGIVSPYFDSLGGGERYMLAIASHLSKNHTVDVFWTDAGLLERAQSRFNLDLKLVSIVSNIFADGSFLAKMNITKKYDVLFFLTDGSIPTSFAKHNILHMQVPFTHIDMPFWKKWHFDAVVYNSQFTKDHVASVVQKMPHRIIYPPVDPVPVSKATKSKMILSVGRFGGLYNAKKFDVLIQAFERFVSKKQFSSYTLTLSGGVLPSDEKEFEELRKKASHLPVTFFPNCTYKELVSLYEQSVVYWHAAGFGETKPEYMEHFGIAPVEAMSAGTIPIVFNGGGLSEIITDGENGYLWTTVDELVEKTGSVLEDPTRLKELSIRVCASAVRFSTEVFNKKIDTLIDDVV